MTNGEKYKEELLEIAKNDDGIFAVNSISNKVVPCIPLPCKNCLFDATNCRGRKIEWLFAEYKELKINIPPDTPIDTKVLASHDGINWNKRYYAGHINGKYWTWSNGVTSWSAVNENDVTSWKYMRLADGEEA